GVEADAQWSGQSDSACVSACLPAGANGTLLSLIDEQKLNWFGTARARVGWIAPSGTLWYATGGAAFGQVEQTLTLAAKPFFFAGGTTASTASFSHERVGWTVGGGVEAPLAGNWSAKAKYLYVDLGHVPDSFSRALGAALVPATTQATTSSYSIHDHIVRFGLNYRFGEPFPSYAPSSPMFTKAPVQVASRSWTGFYLGVNGGASIGRNHTTDTTVVPGLAFPVFGADSFDNAPIGGIFGGQVGWNWQAAPSWLLGVEADAQWSGQSVSNCVSACLPAGAGGVLLGLTDEQKLKWFGTARGRIGWVAPSGTLWYATGGVAWGGVEQTLTLAPPPP